MGIRQTQSTIAVTTATAANIPLPTSFVLYVASFSLTGFFEARFGAKGTEGFRKAQRRFIESLAAYSIACYILQIKDRYCFAYLCCFQYFSCGYLCVSVCLSVCVHYVFDLVCLVSFVYLFCLCACVRVCVAMVSPAMSLGACRSIMTCLLSLAYSVVHSRVLACLLALLALLACLLCSRFLACSLSLSLAHSLARPTLYILSLIHI